MNGIFEIIRKGNTGLPLAWKPPHAVGVALKRKRQKKKKKKERK